MRQRHSSRPIRISPVPTFDSHTYLINFSNGTVDLAVAGQLVFRPHSRADFLTKLIHYPYTASVADPAPASSSCPTCPTFLSFFSHILPDPDVRLYLQRAFGYTLTGIVSEKSMFVCHGSGDNGKSTLLGIFHTLFAEYSCQIRITSLIADQEGNNKQADLSALCGARFARTSEGDRGQRLAEGTLKAIVSGTDNRIKLTPKFSNGIDFPETHKLWFDTNHLPVVRGTDNAIWNRMRPIAFNVIIPKTEQDQDLPAKLRAEAAGILAWAMDGAVAWRASGLGPLPRSIRAAVDLWRSSSDQFSGFLAERCSMSGHVFAEDLYKAFVNWAAEEGEPTPLTRRELAKKLADTPGVEKRRVTAGIQYRGISLRAARGGGGRVGSTPAEQTEEPDAV